MAAGRLALLALLALAAVACTPRQEPEPDAARVLALRAFVGTEPSARAARWLPHIVVYDDGRVVAEDDDVVQRRAEERIYRVFTLAPAELDALRTAIADSGVLALPERVEPAGGVVGPGRSDVVIQVDLGQGPHIVRAYALTEAGPGAYPEGLLAVDALLGALDARAQTEGEQRGPDPRRPLPRIPGSQGVAR